jgi:hypothetical protein
MRKGSGPRRPRDDLSVLSDGFTRRKLLEGTVVATTVAAFGGCAAAPVRPGLSPWPPNEHGCRARFCRYFRPAPGLSEEVGACFAFTRG